ncbi:MAG TPA: hypothetical protein VF945_04450, partial [Polyangia bacterium]
PCAPTLGDARARFCPPDGGVNGRLPITADCGAFFVLYVSDVDVSEDFYYDAVTGALVAVIEVSANFSGSPACDGGPAMFTPPRCQPSVALCN